jgi:MFS superfamily sulfate permease-like transporter
MLSAIGIIILSKQVHLILGNSPLDAEGNPLIEPIELLMAIPDSLNNINHISTIIGLIGMTIVLTWHRMPIAFLRKFPAPLIVLLMTIPLSMVLKLPKEQTIQFQQNFFDSIRFQLDFSGWENFGIFIKYILLFAIIGSLESLLTVRAVDIQTPKEPKSNPNKDLISIGFGNILRSFFGGLPMISEVARSSANVSSGAKTHWSSFFHGFFILLFLVFSVHFSGFIPTAALSALLVAVGIRLINPKEFFKIFKLGKEQFLVFISTIIMTLFTDLLIGISMGILVNIGFLYFNGTPLQRIFRPKLHWKGNVLMVDEAATFANWLGIQKEINTKKRSEHIVIDFSNCSIMDQTVQENVFHLGVEFSKSGGSLISR